MIELYLLRHGLAKKREDWAGKKDSDRPLTGRGEKRMGIEARALKKSGISFDLILSSPFVRARRTAEIVAQTLGVGGKLNLTASLTPRVSPRRFLQELVPYLDVSKVLIV